jgi:hypothetical protein
MRAFHLSEIEPKKLILIVYLYLQAMTACAEFVPFSFEFFESVRYQQNVQDVSLLKWA